MSDIIEFIKSNQVGILKERLAKLPETSYVAPFTQWAEEHRYFPEGTSEVPGMFKRSTVPHMVEILERLHPDDPCTHIAVMKSVQAAATTTIAENALGAFIANKLGSVLFLTSSKGIGNIRSSSSIDVLIDHADMVVKPMSDRRKRKTGDAALYKEFAGNIKLLISSYNSIADLKSNTFHLIVCDEWDEARSELKGQGDIEGLIEGRTMGLHSGYKILKLSTSSNAETSRIYKSFLEGDQREYYVPCPHCGKMQRLVMKSKDFNYGLTFTTQTNKELRKKVLVPETVRYICQYCGEPFYEFEKLDFLKLGEWRPTVQQQDPYKYSYHISGLISPFLSWRRICQEFMNCDYGGDVLRFKNFVINFLGKPWASPHETMAWETFRDKADDYYYPIPPEGTEVQSEEYGLEYTRGPLLFYGGVDVQGDRLELQVVGFGIGMESWSVDYQVFYGDTSDLSSICWQALSDYVYQTTYQVGGVPVLIDVVAIDVGWDPREAKHPDSQKTNVVYEFVSHRQDIFIAIMGVDEDKQGELIKEARVKNGGSLTKRYNVSSGLFKHAIMRDVSLSDGPRAIHFPRRQMNANGSIVLIDNFHYKQFMSEKYMEIKQGVYGWRKINQRNEVLDTWIYARAAAEFHSTALKSRFDWVELYLAYKAD